MVLGPVPAEAAKADRRRTEESERRRVDEERLREQEQRLREEEQRQLEEERGRRAREEKQRAEDDARRSSRDTGGLGQQITATRVVQGAMPALNVTANLKPGPQHVAPFSIKPLLIALSIAAVIWLVMTLIALNQ